MMIFEVIFKDRGYVVIEHEAESHVQKDGKLGSIIVKDGKEIYSLFFFERKEVAFSEAKTLNNLRQLQRDNFNMSL